MWHEEGAEGRAGCVGKPAAKVVVPEGADGAGVRPIAAFVGLSPEEIAAQIEENGDEELLFGLANGLLDLKVPWPDVERIRCVQGVWGGVVGVGR